MARFFTDESSHIARNNDSRVVRLHCGHRTILLPGDAEIQAKYCILSGVDATHLHAAVLKVGHHGSKNSTMPEFLAAVDPKIAIISAGEQNPYGHPSPDLLQRLRENGLKVLRTDHERAIRVLTDGTAIHVNCFVPCTDGNNLSGSADAPDDH